MRFQTKNGVLIAQANGETLRIEPWGKDSLRVRATMLPGFSGKDWALTEVPEKTEAKAEQFAVDHLEIDGSMGKRTSASITNGKIRAVVNFAGDIMAPEGESAHREGKAAAQGFCHGRIVCGAVAAPVYREFLASCCCTSRKQNCLVLAFYFF